MNPDVLTRAREAYAAGRLDAAARLCNQGLKQAPGHPGLLLLLGHLETVRGRTRRAVALLRRASSDRPELPEVHNALALALKAQGDTDDAAAACKQALAADPGFLPARINLGNIHYQRHEYERAAATYRAALERDPGMAQAEHYLGMTLARMGDVETAIRHYRRALARRPDLEAAHSELLLELHTLPDIDAQTLYREHCHWGSAYMRRVTQLPSKRAKEPGASARVRVGYLSQDLRRHSVAYFLEPILRGHDHSAFHITLYQAASEGDEVTRRLRALADRWRDIARMGDSEAAEQIQRDGIDILVDLGGHTPGSRLRVLAHRPAPVQLTYLGYPDTTGLPTVDYRLTDDRADPRGYEGYYVEELVHLEPGFLCYQPPPQAPAVAELPARSNGYITFGSFNDATKLNPEVIAVWARILRSVPDARLLLKARSFANGAVRRRYTALAAEHEIPAERLLFMSRIDSDSGHLGAYGEVDIALDPFPYNGTTTTCEALWMGVPVVTLAGATHAGRVGLSLLWQVGLQEWAAGDKERYVQLAVSLASDCDRLADLRGGLREQVQSSSLCDPERFTRTLEAVYRRVGQSSP